MVYTNIVEFEWDAQKHTSNLAKHHIVFENAVMVFFDPFALVEHDSKHSNKEYRYIIIGRFELILLQVVYVLREPRIYRIISARMASKKERRLYANR